MKTQNSIHLFSLLNFEIHFDCLIEIMLNYFLSCGCIVHMFVCAHEQRPKTSAIPHFLHYF